HPQILYDSALSNQVMIDCDYLKDEQTDRCNPTIKQDESLYCNNLLGQFYLLQTVRSTFPHIIVQFFLIALVAHWVLQYILHKVQSMLLLYSLKTSEFLDLRDVKNLLHHQITLYVKKCHACRYQ